MFQKFAPMKNLLPGAGFTIVTEPGAPPVAEPPVPWLDEPPVGAGEPPVDDSTPPVAEPPVEATPPLDVALDPPTPPLDEPPVAPLHRRHPQAPPVPLPQRLWASFVTLVSPVSLPTAPVSAAQPPDKNAKLERNETTTGPKMTSLSCIGETSAETYT